ncbi:MAG: SGNH/GDSL hydrolase family protein [Clostridia bacterium]|nr:SGNH/GDSL hydrolase family protein [Clostridia bacterium]
MILTEQQIKAMTKGAARIEVENGSYRFLRFTEAEQATYANHPRKPNFYVPTFHTAGVRWAFRTDSNVLEFDISNDIATNQDKATFDVYEDGALRRTVTVEFKYITAGHVRIPLTEGEKLVEIYFPYHARMTVANVALADGAAFAPVSRKYKMLAYGDSITHGSTTSHPSLSYATRVAAMLNADVVNKGIGGEHFYPALICDKTPEDPDWITVAYGSNDWKHCTPEEFDENCTGVLQGLTKLYPTVPIFVISPTWRSDANIETPFGAPANEIHAQICKNAEAFPNVTVIRGWNLVPHNGEFFADNRLHPNDLGFGIYAANLYRELIPHLIEKIGYSFQ